MYKRQALDVTVQQTVLDLIGDLQRERELAVLFITHDLALAHDRADELVVLRGGRAVEKGPVQQVLEAPRDAYTIKLVSDAPALAPSRYAALRKPGLALVAEPPAIVVEGLGKHYPGAPGQSPALDAVDLDVASGSIHAPVSYTHLTLPTSDLV